MLDSIRKEKTHDVIKCYDSKDDKFICQLQKIKCLFADKVNQIYMQERFGVNLCALLPDLTKLSDLKDLMEYISTMDLSHFTSNTYRNHIIIDDELLDSDCLSDFSTESLRVCNISNLIEKINSL